jgi:DNA-binding NtrC family response regulator
MEHASRSDLEEAVSQLGLDELEDRARRANGGRPLPLRDWLALAEAWRIAQALRETRGNRSAAARALGIGRRTLYTKMEKLGLTPVWLVPDPNGSKGNGANGSNGSNGSV